MGERYRGREIGASYSHVQGVVALHNFTYVLHASLCASVLLYNVLLYSVILYSVLLYSVRHLLYVQ